MTGECVWQTHFADGDFCRKQSKHTEKKGAQDGLNIHRFLSMDESMLRNSETQGCFAHSATWQNAMSVDGPAIHFSAVFDYDSEFMKRNGWTNVNW